MAAATFRVQSLCFLFVFGCLAAEYSSAGAADPEPKNFRRPADDADLKYWLENGTDETLSDMRVQNCVMLKGAPGFNQLTNDHNVVRDPYIARQSDDGGRWIVTAWDPGLRAWGNKECPCLHSDPQIPDCRPGETQKVHGWLSFFEGSDIQAEFDRIEQTGWRTSE